MQRMVFAGIIVSLFGLVGCGSDNGSTPTYPMRVISERIANDLVDQYTQVELDLEPAMLVSDWDEPVTEGRTWVMSNFDLISGEHKASLVEIRNGEPSTIMDPTLKVRVDGAEGGPTPLCMSPDGTFGFTIESDDEVGQHPVGEFFDCYHPVLRVRSRR